MNRFFHSYTPIHRMIARPTSGGGIRWSSYVGDLRCFDNLSKSSATSATATARIAAANATAAAHNRNNASSHGSEVGVRSFSTKPAIKPALGTSSRCKSICSGTRSAPHERLLVLGSGVAGCAAALSAARHGVPVTVLHAGSDKEDCNSYWAQGGIIYRNYRLREEQERKEGKGESDGDEGGDPPLVDTPLSLVNDIRVASGYRQPLRRSNLLEEGAYSASHVLNGPTSLGATCPDSGVTWNEDAAWKLACEGPARVRELLLGSKDGGVGEALGCVVPFDRNDDDVLSLCLEASHAAPRIIHQADCTGRAITVEITKAAVEHPLIEFVGDAVATDLISDEEGEGTILGARVLDKRTNRQRDYYAVHGTVLASGGLAGIYEHSTNPSGFNALGSSAGLALRLEERLTGSAGNYGSRTSSGIVSDLEYVQFHPTALCVPNEPRFLLTEALRGEGAILRDASGRAFARDYHPAGELAPRDVVARAVYMESQKMHPDEGHNSFLDISHRDASWLRGRFPTVNDHLASRDRPMDFTRDRIPVIPAAHYTCGGVTTDLSGRVVGEPGAGWYRNLYAAGESARTGLHGGNRLASTSLLEGLVFGSSVGETVAGAIVDEEGDEAMETADRARHAIEQRLAMGLATGLPSPSGAAADPSVAREASAVLARLRSIMWDGVGLVRDASGLARAASDLSAIRDVAEELWERDGAGWEAAALRDASAAGLAVAEAAAANEVSGGGHYRVCEEEGASGDAGEERDSDDEDDGLVAARA